MAEPNDDDLALARKLSMVRTPCLHLAALFAQHREQRERAAARAATLATIAKVRDWYDNGKSWVLPAFLDELEKETNRE